MHFLHKFKPRGCGQSGAPLSITITGQAVLSLISGYARTWRLLLQYDEDSLALPEGCLPARGVLDPDSCPGIAWIPAWLRLPDAAQAARQGRTIPFPEDRA